MSKIFSIIVFLLFCSFYSFSQDRVITGTVTDESGQPLSDVSVLVKGTNQGTVTSSEGTYSLSVPENKNAIVFSSVGRETMEVNIDGKTVINVSLPISTGQLQEVVINVPYGTIKKTAFTGSENTITAQTISKQPVTSVTRALDGLVPGIIATNGGGAPGSGSSIMIRGIGSKLASSTPLYVLDGVPYDGSISALNVNDIESVTLLKDAAAAALYGSRAANGVVMIETKKGRKGAPQTTISFDKGFLTRGIPEYDRVGPKDYYELFWEAYRNNYISQGEDPVTAGQLASNVLAGPNGLVYNAYNVPDDELVDPATGLLNSGAELLWNESWEEAMFRTAQRTSAYFNVSGAANKLDYFLSAGYLNEEGIALYSGYERYNMRLNLNMDATEWLKTGLNLDGSFGNYDNVPSGGSATTNPFYFTRRMGPIYPVYQHDLTTGAFVPDSVTGEPKLDWGVPEQMGTRPYAGRANLLGSLDLDERSSKVFSGNANTYAEITFLNDFSFKATLGLNFYNSNGTDYQNNQYGDAAPTPGLSDGGRSTKSNFRQISLTANEVLSYNKILGKHNVRALIGHENYRWQSHYLAAYKSGFVYPGQTELDNGDEVFSPPTSYADNHRIESYFAGVNYTLDDKYLISGSYRTDGSSRFASDVRWGDFYSAGVGWRISEENFMSSVGWINELKLKASYGEQGNENIGLLYPYITYYYADGSGNYDQPIRPVNASLLWEGNSTTNIGIEFAILNRRLMGTVEWFNRVSDNLLFDVPLPPSLGSPSVYQNIGTMKNSGIEVQLGAEVIQGRDFRWRMDVNFTHFKNEITRLPPNQRENGIVEGTKKLLEGHGFYDYWLREYAGVDASTGDALYYMDVLDDDGKATGERVLTNEINEATYYYHGSALPDFSGGITNVFSYRDISLSVLLVYSYGGYFYDGNYALLMHRGSPGAAWHTDMLNRWQKPGDVTNIPRLQYSIAGQDGASTRWLFDRSYLNIKNVNLSYSLPERLAGKLYLDGLDFHVGVFNAWLFSAHKGMDPQQDFSGTSDATYTPYRTVSVGITAKLK